MLSNKVQSALNAQINAEFWSAYLSTSQWLATSMPKESPESPTGSASSSRKSRLTLRYS